MTGKQYQDRIRAGQDEMSAALGYPGKSWRSLATEMKNNPNHPLRRMREENERMRATLTILATAVSEVFDVGGIRMVRASVVDDIRAIAEAALKGGE